MMAVWRYFSKNYEQQSGCYSSYSTELQPWSNKGGAAYGSQCYCSNFTISSRRCQLFSQTPHSGTNREKERINDRLHGFDPKDNIAWKEITKRFGTNIKQPELLSIAEVLANYANVKLDRDAKRRKTVLIKWFSENWPLISPYLHYVVLEDSQK